MNMPSLIEQLKEMDGKDREAIEASLGSYLYSEIMQRSPGLIVEIGTGHGYSTSWLMVGLDALGAGEIITFDEVERSPFVWETIFKETPRLTKVVGKFNENIELVPNLVDMVFMDGEHSIDKIVRDIELIEPKLSSRAVIYIHDTVYCEEMGACLRDYFEGKETDRLKAIPIKPSSSSWIYEELKMGSGLGIAKKRGKRNVN